MHGTALLVIDMQNGFCMPDGSLPRLGMSLAGVAEAVANTAAAIADARAANLPVIFTRHAYRSGYADAGRTFRQNRVQLMEAGALLSGSWDAAVVEALEFRPDDLVIDKVRYDAFLQTSLEFLLQSLEVQRLVVTGVVTNVCVESTVRSAFMRDFAVTLLRDCCAARTERLHDIALEALAAYEFADMAAWSDGFRFDTLEVAA